MKNQQLIRGLLIVVAVLFFTISLGSRLFTTIDPGNKGVLFERFGKGLDKENIYGQGFHIIAPWNELHVYDVREKQQEEAMDVLSSDGLNISVDISVRVHPIHDKIGYLHEEFGTNYMEEVVIPEIRSSVRNVIGRYTPEELYSTKRDEVQTQILDESHKVLAANHIEMRALLIRSVKLPASIQGAIELKLREEQEALAYKFKIEREKLEAERKAIEAGGIRDFQEIVAKGLSRDYLKWKGIEATEHLANSTNSKVVIIGNSDGLPLILDTK